MMNKRNQWRKAGKRVFGFIDERLDKAYRLLFEPSNKAGCVICDEDDSSVLDIHEMDDSNGFKVLCSRCHGVTRQSFDNKLQNQIGGVNV